MNFIELFAGCGGLSLGLKSTGFNLAMANELSPMAAESYAYNFFREDFCKELAGSNLTNTFWLSSKYPLSQLSLRLRENPKEYPELNSGFTDMPSCFTFSERMLIVGSIVTLNKWLEVNVSSASDFKSSLKDLDLVSGGPPCQSFSMAGLRNKDCEKNTLPWEFAKFAKFAQPKIVLLENVTGILRPFKDSDGEKYYAWFELAKAFSNIGYIPLCLHVNAKFVGVPQNRPRFILLGVREDFFDKIKSNFCSEEKLLFSQPYGFFIKCKSGESVNFGALQVRDVTNDKDLLLFRNSFLAPLVSAIDNVTSVFDAIDDLRLIDTKKSSYSKYLSEVFKECLDEHPLSNHELRSNNSLVKRRFRIYQVIQQLDADTRKRIQQILKGASHELFDADMISISVHSFLGLSGEKISFCDKESFISFLQKHITKKQTQKALVPNLPAPAALSIPDDACHYHEEELRTLTVREMARIQSFPDNFVFRSKITTGGKMRQYEIPQYTQVGNAVPPLLGRALGLAIARLIDKA